MSATTDKIFQAYNSGELYRRVNPTESSCEEVESISSLILLCYSYQWETDLAEKENILKTIEEIVDDAPINLSQCKDVGSCQSKYDLYYHVSSEHD